MTHAQGMQRGAMLTFTRDDTTWDNVVDVNTDTVCEIEFCH